MNRMMRLAVVSSLLVLGAPLPAAAQDTLASARQLYGSAAYDEALSMLDRLKTTAQPAPGEVMAVEQYRAFCLMALGRQSDAAGAIESVVAADPYFVPAESDVAPRVLAAFREARLRLLPGIAQQRYLSAKAAYDRKDFAGALEGFEATGRLIDAPDLAEASARPPLSDLRTLAAGFRDLARAAAAPPPLPEPIVPPPAAAAPEPARAASPPKALYTAGDPGVVPPEPIIQTVPRWQETGIPGFAVRGRQGVLELVITAQGAVESAVMSQSVSRAYDAAVVAKARGWKYRPASKDGVPVRFKKAMQIKLE